MFVIIIPTYAVIYLDKCKWLAIISHFQDLLYFYNAARTVCIEKIMINKYIVILLIGVCLLGGCQQLCAYMMNIDDHNHFGSYC